MEALIQTGLAVLGVVLIVWWNAVRSPKYDKFNFKFWLEDNTEVILLTFMGLLLVSVLNYSTEDSLSFVYEIIGLDLTNTRSGWVFFGISLYELIRKFKIKNSDGTATKETHD